MLLHVVGQRISAQAAFTIYDRINALAGGGVLTAQAVAELGLQRLRGCGLARARAEYAIAMAEAELYGSLDIEHLDAVSDSEAVARLTVVRGIGLWSAQTFLVHNLARPAWPGLRIGCSPRRCYGVRCARSGSLGSQGACVASASLR